MSREYGFFQALDCSQTKSQTVPYLLGHFEEMCKGLLKSKLDITRCLYSRDVVFLGDEWCCQCITITASLCCGHIVSSVYLHAPQTTIELLTHLARVEREGPNSTNSI